MDFRTKLDYSDNRQLKQRERTITTLSGTTTFGVPFSALTSGPDLSATAQTSQFLGVVSTYSGNSATTVFTWGIPNVSIVEPYISALTPSNSGVSQNINAIFNSSSSTIIDGNLVNLTYSGVSAQNFYAITMTEPTPGNYTGTVSTDFFVYSAKTLDFTGRTIWVDSKEILRTKKLIVSNNPQPGYVLTCINSEGMVEFQPVSGSSSGNTYWSASTGVNAIVTKFSNSIASGTSSLAEGSLNIAGGDYSHAEGLSTRAFGYTSHSEGVSAIASGDSSHAEGSVTRTFGYASHAEGGSTTSIGDFSHAEGTSTISSGNSSHSEGYYTEANGNYSHSEGNQSTAFDEGSHSEGVLTTAIGIAAHSEGYISRAIGQYSHSEGSSTRAIGTSSHAEGDNTRASGSYSHAEGSSTTASGAFGSHAEGDNTTASGASSHAEGWFTTANGQYSHSEGSLTTANGTSSHAGGVSSRANGSFSFVHGFNSEANGSSTIILGDNITGSTNNIVYVSDLIIDGLVNTDPIATDANGKIVAGTSDIRLKKNIVDLPSPLDVVKNLRGVAFEYTDESNMGPGIRFGFIAQEVQEIVPELVRFRAKGDGMLNLSYTEIVPWIVEAIKELTSGSEKILETQTIASEDNNIELNYNGTKLTSIGGGISVISGISDKVNAEFILNSDGDWITNNHIIPSGLIIPYYTPTSSNDTYGKIGEIVNDDTYLYIKTKSGWLRSMLEKF